NGVARCGCNFDCGAGLVVHPGARHDQIRRTKPALAGGDHRNCFTYLFAFDNRLFLADSWLSCLVWNSDWLRPGAVALHLAGGRHCASAPAGMSSVKQLPWVWVDWT